MAFTDHCDVFLSALEAGINRVLRHVRRQWPSMFNYGTQAVADNLQLLCVQIDVHPAVPLKGNPIITVLPPVPVVGTLYGLDYCAQLTEAVIDFNPSNLFALPPQLSPLGAQRLAAKASVCGGLACPPNDVVDHLPVKLVPPDPPPAQNKRDYAGKTDVGHAAQPKDQPKDKRDDQPDLAIDVIPTRGFRCFCLDGFVVAGAQFAPDTTPAHTQHIIGRLDGIEIVDITPDELESTIECYGALVVKLFLFPQLAMKPVEFVQKDLMGTQVTITPSLISGDIPNNPAIEDDLLKAFLKLDLTIPPTGPPGGGGPGGSPAPPLAPGVDVARIRSGPFDLTIALSAGAVTVLFNGIRDAFTFSKSDSFNFGPFTMGYAVGLHLKGGTIELRNDGTIRIKELDIKWDTAKVWFGIDIPEICVGGFCIIPNPFTGGCAVRAPKICVFSANPDIGPSLDISGLITSEISATIRPKVQYSTNHPPGPTSAWDAQVTKTQNRWIVVAHIIRIDFDLFDIADIVGDLLHNALESAVNNLLGGLPGWAKSLILAIIGPIIDFIADIIDLPDDIGEWLEDKLGVTFGLFDLILTAIADHLAAGEPLIKLEDPFPVESPTGLMDLMIPIEFLDVRVNEHELIVEGDIGG